MSETPLWRFEELATATRGVIEGETGLAAVSGVSIDTRTLSPGDLFVALSDARDGHDFVSTAFARGAALALVAKDYRKKDGDGPLLRVDDPLRGLERIAAAARSRLGAKARVVAVTGSAGKTTTKEMMRLGFAVAGRVHASEKSYNNHWGVPLTLARMPRETRFAIIEMGMNHAGEIGPLSRLARPHIAVITSVLPVHLEHFSGIEGIAAAKAEIFEGLETDGRIILPRDSEQFDFLFGRAVEAVGARGDQIVSFGADERADNRLGAVETALRGSRAVLHRQNGEAISFEVGLPGRHNVQNGAACLSAWFAATADLEDVGAASRGLEFLQKALAQMEMEPAGRGQVFELSAPGKGAITLIDESYNANPASMRAALENLSLYPPGRRKVAVIGDMLELGDSTDALHIALAGPIAKAGVERVFTCGVQMKKLFAALPDRLQGGHGEEVSDLGAVLLEDIREGDIIMVKGSNGIGLGSLVEILRQHYSGPLQADT